MMLARLKRWLLPEKPQRDPDFAARMHTARAFGIEQKRESLRVQRELRQRQANQIEAAYLSRKEPRDA